MIDLKLVNFFADFKHKLEILSLSDLHEKKYLKLNLFDNNKILNFLKVVT